MDKDVTGLVDYENNDDESLPITKCVCGRQFTPWDFIISIYRDHPDRCIECGAKLYFQLGIRVYQVDETQVSDKPIPQASLDDIIEFLSYLPL